MLPKLGFVDHIKNVLWVLQSTVAWSVLVLHVSRYMASQYQIIVKAGFALHCLMRKIYIDIVITL